MIYRLLKPKTTISGRLENSSGEWFQCTYRVLAASLPLAEGESFKVRIFVDHSVIEVFSNHGIALSSRVYPLKADSQAVSAFATGNTCQLISCEAWEMSCID